MTLEPDGPACNCGNRGCWETLVGPSAILRRVQQAVADLQEGEGQDSMQMEQVLRAAERGDPAVLKALDEVGGYLGIGIANLINALNPSLVVLGGVLSLAGPYVLPRAQQEVDARALAVARASARLCISAFKFDACVMGGVALIVRGVLNNPAAWQPPSPALALDSQFVPGGSAL